jgi:AbrB family transcriptional regulator (stage V sporulation protein T)
MKATGIVRRIDDLGRVIIPKEVRRNFGIREGDPLEIYTDRDGAIIFKKYAPNNTNDVVVYLVHSARALGFEIGVYDDLGAWRGGSRFGSINERISIDDNKEDLIPVADEAVYDRAFLFIKVTKTSPKATLESIKALAQMASVMLNEG